MNQSYREGLALLKGRGEEPSASDFEIGRDKIAKASVVFPPAMAHLAALDALHIGGQSNDTQTASTFMKAAMSGFPPAVRGLASILLGDPRTEAMGAGLLRRAAHAGDWIAAFLILRETLRGRVIANVEECRHLAGQLSEAVPFRSEITAGVTTLQTGAALLTPAPFARTPSEAVVISALETASDFLPNSLSSDPDIATFSSVLSPLECDYLVAASSPLMQPSKVVDGDEGGAISASFRTSDGAVLLPAHMDLNTVIIWRKLAKAAGVAPEQGEFLSLLRYRPGQEYLPHHDFLPLDAADYSRVKSCGQRKRTLLTYLNGGYSGGETAFPKLEITYKGQVGDCLRFDNTDAAGAPIDNSLHAGLPVTSGEKWLATLWCREKPFWPWMR